MGLNRVSREREAADTQQQLLDYISAFSPDELIQERRKHPVRGAGGHATASSALLRKLARLAGERPEDWEILRRYILEMSWSFLGSRLAVSTNQDDREIVRHVMRQTGAWQALLGLYNALNPGHMTGELDRRQGLKVG